MSFPRIPYSKDARGISSIEYSLLVSVAITAASFMGVGVSHGITASLKQSYIDVLNSATVPLAPASKPCLEGAHGKSVICPGITSQFK